MGTVSLPYHLVFDILSRASVKSVCRFRCVSKTWRDLISGPVFAAAHKSRHGPLLVDTGSYPKEEPIGGRDMRLLDMDGNVVRVLKGVGGYGMLSNSGLDDLICVNGAACGGINVVDPATGEVLLSCPQMDILEHDKFPYAAQRYYTTFGFGRAVPSGEYKLVRLGADRTTEVLTLGDGGRGWRHVQPSPRNICSKRGSPVVVDGLMYVFHEHEKGYVNYDNLRCFDLDSERWKGDVIQGPLRVSDASRTCRTLAIRLTELNGALCFVQSVFDDTGYYGTKVNQPAAADPVTNIWILVSSDRRSWTKEYTITMAPSACRYMPLRVLHDGKLLLHCSFDRGGDYEEEEEEGWSLALQIYDPDTGTRTDILGAPDDLAGRIGLCNFRLDNSVSSKPLLARFFDQALSFFGN